MTLEPRRLTTIFTKRPRPGAVKTRLCPPLSAEAAARLCEAMLADTVHKCIGCLEFETSLSATPASDAEWFRGRFPELSEVRVQCGPDLGARLADHFAREHLARPGWSLVVIGSDAPHVPVERVVAAHRALEGGADVVIGPDLGGGYYLVGLRQSFPELFQAVSMSTPDMCAQTVALAQSMGLSVSLIEADYDIDDARDARRLWLDLQRCDGAPVRLVHTERELRELAPTLCP